MRAENITVERFLTACKTVVDLARTQGWRYGDSKAVPPCSDKTISCDRLIARALYDLGFTDQRKGGETCGSLEDYLIAHGFNKSYDFNDIRRGSIILVKHNGQNFWGHAFVCLTYDPKTFVTSRYDTGSNERIKSVQPLTDVNWAYRKDIVGVFNIPAKPAAHKLTQQGQRYLRVFMRTGGEPRADGIYNANWEKLWIKGIQTALNKDYKAGLKVDGIFGAKTQAALDKHPCTYGTFSYTNSMLEIGFYLRNINPNGYELPGHYGDRLTKAVERLMGSSGQKAGRTVFATLIGG